MSKEMFQGRFYGCICSNKFLSSRQTRKIEKYLKRRGKKVNRIKYFIDKHWELILIIISLTTLILVISSYVGVWYCLKKVHDCSVIIEKIVR